MIRRYLALWALAGVVSGGSAAWAQVSANGPPAPPPPAVVPEAYESPRATLVTFLKAMNALENDPVNPDLWQRVYGALDQPRGMPEESRRNEARSLLAVFNAIGELVPAMVAPDRAEVENANLTAFELLPDNRYTRQPANEPAHRLFEQAFESARERGAGRLPPVRLARMEDGRWRFSRATLDESLRLSSWARLMGTAFGQDVLREVQSEVVRRWIPRQLQNRFFLGVELWQWIGLAIIIFLALLADVLGRMFLTPLLARLMHRHIATAADEDLRATVRPLGLAVGAGAFLLMVGVLGLVGMPATVMNVAGRLVLTFGLAWAAWSLTDLMAGALLRRPKEHQRAFDDMLVPLLRKTAKLFIAAMGVLYVAATFDIELLPLLASFGIAGLAISFAAQDMVKNLFGGLTIFLDQPFRVGERINYKGFDGTVEEIGFRITRMRTLVGHLVTIPNGGITSEPVENITRRPSLRRIMNITITYDTPKEKIEQAVQIVRDIFEEPGIREPIHQYLNGELMAPRVFFNQFNSDSLNIFAIYWYIPPEWWPYNEHAHRVNLRIFEEFEKAGIEFAFPTQTLYLAGDPKRELAVRMLADQNPSDPRD